MKSLIIIIGMMVSIPFAFAPEAKAEDTSKRQIPLKVAILPVAIHSPENLKYIQEGLLDMLSSRVELTGRVAVVEKSVIKKALAQVSDEMDTQAARKLGQDLGVDFVVYGSLTKLGESASLDLRVVDVKGEEAGIPIYVQAKKTEEIIARVDDLARKVDEKILGYSLSPAIAEKPAEASKEMAAFPPSTPGPRPMVPVTPEKAAPPVGMWRSQSLPFHINGMAVGDVDGDGRNEVVLIEDRKLSIYRYEKEFKLLKRIEGGRLDHFLAVDVGDIQKDGKAEIFVTNLQGERLASFAVAHRDGDFQIVSKDLDWFLRVIEWGQKGKVLLGQKKGIQTGAEGAIYELQWDGKSYKEVKAEVPKGPTIYGFCPFPHDGKMSYVFIDSDFRLKAIDPKGKMIWRSKDTYGSDIAFRVKDVSPGTSYSEGDDLAFVNVRVISREDEIFIIHNTSPIGQFFKRQKYYSGGEVQRLGWNGAMFMENWKSQEIPGYVVDFQIQDIFGSQGKELVVAVNLPKESILSGDKSSALMFNRIQ